MSKPDDAKHSSARFPKPTNHSASPRRGGKPAASSRGPSSSQASGPNASRGRPSVAADESGRGARDAAALALHAVLHHGRSFDDVLAVGASQRNLAARDLAFARAISAAALRHRGSLQHVLSRFLEKPLPKDTGRLESILLSAVAQLLILKTPPHAVISIAVDQVRADRKAQRFHKLANAVLRRVSEKGSEILGGLDAVELDVPAWIYRRWEATYGAPLARAIATASLQEAALDLTVKEDVEHWAARLNGRVLPTGSLRLIAGGRIDALEGYADGAWWVQDAAAALPVKLLGDVRGLQVADLCAAPGGKTAQLAAQGALVTAIDSSPDRLTRLKTNLARLKLEAQTQLADATAWRPAALFDAIVVDAPCTATGTIRRHPDILHLKRPEDTARLSAIQSAILDTAAAAVKPGGRLVYCTCSLESEEGPEQIAVFLAQHPEFRRAPIDAARLGLAADWLTPDGDLRTLPSHLGDLPDDMRGLDGFYAALLVKEA